MEIIIVVAGTLILIGLLGLGFICWLNKTTSSDELLNKENYASCENESYPSNVVDENGVNITYHAELGKED
jgi:hypothetical protein